MHRYVMPESVKDRVLRRQGKLLSHDTIEAGRAALVVIDMQNYFCAEGFPAEVPLARAIVPTINRLARAMRAAGGTVVWVQTDSAQALARWGNHHKHMLTPERVEKRLAGLDAAAEGFALFGDLEALSGDLRVKKVTYSAFMPGSSDIDAQLAGRGIDTVLIAGTATNVCCEFERARRDVARLPGDHAFRRQCDMDRRRARGDAQLLCDVLRRRHEFG